MSDGETESIEEPEPVNIVARGSFGQEFDLDVVESVLDRVEDSRGFGGSLVWRFDDIDVANVSLFGTGTVMIMGAEREADVDTAFERVRDQLVDAGLLE